VKAPKNQWYCAAFGHEVSQAPFARTFLSEPVVMYRTGDGTPVAFEDRCCHRRAPLSAGKVEGDNLRCGYHGLVYAPSGAVIWAPGQDRLPQDARVRVYPIVEKHGWIWIWMGDPALAAANAAPAYDKYDDPRWTAHCELLPIGSNYFLLVENLLDLSHVAFLHANTIGSPEDIAPKLTWERGPDWVKGTRVSRGLSPSPRNVQEGFDFPFDRTQIMLFEPPSQVTIEILSNEHGKAHGDPADRMNGRMVIYDSITPETESSCHYFSAIAVNRPRRPGHNPTAAPPSAVFREDKIMLEAEQRIIDLAPTSPEIDLVGDSGGLQARRIVERLLIAEQPARRAGE
jgi:phenylpropionate dioxygenase-like ring-hydroxylating dioxygenase large terminal subunit